MASRKIVIAMDGSEYANYAFQWYLQKIRQSNDEVIIVHCPDYSTLFQPETITMSEPFEEEEITAIHDKVTRRNMELEKELRSKIATAKIEGKVVSIYGSPGEMIVRSANQENADLIITGTRGLGKIRRTILGSVSDYVLHHSPVPVVVCPHRREHLIV